MTQQGQVVRFEADVLSTEGSVEKRQVVRAGPFSAVADGKFLVWEAGEGKLRELTRQPPSRYLNTVAGFEDATSGFGTLAVDPSRGQLLAALTDAPSPLRAREPGWRRRLRDPQPGHHGADPRTHPLGRHHRHRPQGQRPAQERLRERGQPARRVLSVFESNRDADAETLELKLDEAVMREASGLQRFLWIVKTISVVAPLLGLLGTVTGMIQTFQAITLFGAGDPKMMAGGISEALVTTMLGLITAIPLVLLYDLLANSSRRIIDILDEQSAGLIAARSARGQRCRSLRPSRGPRFRRAGRQRPARHRARDGGDVDAHLRAVLVLPGATPSGGGERPAPVERLGRPHLVGGPPVPAHADLRRALEASSGAFR